MRPSLAAQYELALLRGDRPQPLGGAWAAPVLGCPKCCCSMVERPCATATHWTCPACGDKFKEGSCKCAE